VPQARAQALTSMSAADFERELNQAIEASDPQALSLIGELKLSSELASWPLSLARASRWAGPGWVLLGDAAHQVHPLAGQGLNLGLADVDTLLNVLVDARRTEPWREPGDERLLQR
jgi:2-polyprenyl-6-methoxyphenol hydroxylase-like FAD-dependent oxidoreductase